MSQRYADIALYSPVRRLFTYRIPEGLELECGHRVRVPLRREVVLGIVVHLHNRKPTFQTRPIHSLVDEDPVVKNDQLELAIWIHRFYFCSMGQILQTLLPAGLNLTGEKRVSMIDRQDPIPADLETMVKQLHEGTHSLKEARSRWREGRDRKRLNRLLREGWALVVEDPIGPGTPRPQKGLRWSGQASDTTIEALVNRGRSNKWKKTLDRLWNEKLLPDTYSRLMEQEDVTRYSLDRIAEEPLVEVVEIEPADPQNGTVEKARKEPNSLRGVQIEAGDAVCQALDKGAFQSFLLHGVTGSGKTEVYIHALAHALRQGRGGIVLVPEIALTPQTVFRFRSVFGSEVAVLHSRLSDRERLDAWNRIREGQARIAIGPRSAVFAPIQRLGLIIVDEEHDGSYKQIDPAPRYHARDVAIMRAWQQDAVVLLGSATPALGSWHAALRGKHRLLELPDRPFGEMPEVRILDLKQYRSAMRGPLTVELEEAMRNALEEGNQVILLYNRRGFASYLICTDCGHIPQSPGSSVSLTYHRKRELLRCHYTGYSRPRDQTCESCGRTNLIPMGSGTQQIEEEVAELFPDWTVLRMDRDTTSGRHAHQNLYDQFLRGDAQILIGTQLVAKGLDFPNVTVVGVLQAETELAFPSWRAGERMFQLLSQVAGRAGRATKPGTVYVQTWKPDHRSVRFAEHHDYKGFASAELEERQSLAYPPWSRMVVFHIRDQEESMAQRVAACIAHSARAKTREGAVLGPSPSVIEQVNGRWNWEVTLKLHPARDDRAIEEVLTAIMAYYEQEKPEGAGRVQIQIDVDAIE
ncbi:MAG: primosomal protein N' [Balneolaceae bacterium]